MMDQATNSPTTNGETRDISLQKAIRTIADRRKVLILTELDRTDALRFKALQRSIGDVSSKPLARALHELEALELVIRTAYAEVPPRVEYRVTDRARSLLPILALLRAWARPIGDEAAAAETRPPGGR
jgi:DNA-binding HxlR family transcriptional regulator